MSTKNSGTKKMPITVPASVQPCQRGPAERRKRSVFASFQELAKKQGVSLSDL